MVNFVLILVFTVHGVQSQLQTWHRHDCPLVLDLNNTLSTLVAHNFDLSQYYTDLDKGPALQILVRKLVFCKLTNRGMAILKVLKGTSEKIYFFVLLENCTCNPHCSVHVDLNTSHKPDIHDSLSKAKSAATEYEKTQDWNKSDPSTPLGSKANLAKRAKQIGTISSVAVGVAITAPLSIPFIIACEPFSHTATYCLIDRHWLTDQAWATKSTDSPLEVKGKKFKISAQVYEEVAKP